MGETQQLSLGVDKVYRWSYEMNLWKNSTVIITTWKIMMIAGMVPVLLMTILTLAEEGFTKGMDLFVKMFFGMIIFVAVLVLIGYVMIALINGGIYYVVFEMSEQGVKHIQMQKQFKKNQILAFITVLAGTASGSPQTAGAGLLAGAKQSSYSHFSKVKKIVIKPMRQVIYISDGINHNQVYANSQDFDFVKEYICSRCKKATIVEAK